MKPLYFLIIFFLIFGCKTVDRQAGGHIDMATQFSTVAIEQPENAEEPATLEFDEDNVLIRYDKGDEFKMDITSDSSGKLIKSIDFKPQNPNELSIRNTTVTTDTGSSYEDLVGQLNVFLENAKFIMWVGVGFLAAGGLFIGLFRDVKTGVVLLGIGAAMLGGYAILPQIYTNWLLVLCGGVVVVPLFWWLTHRRKHRITVNSQKAYEYIKMKYPDVAKEMKMKFTENLHPKDIDHLKKQSKKI